MKTTKIFDFADRMDDENGCHANKVCMIHFDAEYTR
jgi:hypothetical protein